MAYFQEIKTESIVQHTSKETTSDTLDSELFRRVAQYTMQGYKAMQIGDNWAILQNHDVKSDNSITSTTILIKYEV